MQMRAGEGWGRREGSTDDKGSEAGAIAPAAAAIGLMRSLAATGLAPARDPRRIPAVREASNRGTPGRGLRCARQAVSRAPGIAGSGRPRQPRSRTGCGRWGWRRFEKPTAGASRICVPETAVHDRIRYCMLGLPFRMHACGHEGMIGISGNA